MMSATNPRSNNRKGTPRRIDEIQQTLSTCGQDELIGKFLKTGQQFNQKLFLARNVVQKKKILAGKAVVRQSAKGKIATIEKNAMKIFKQDIVINLRFGKMNSNSSNPEKVLPPGMRITSEIVALNFINQLIFYGQSPALVQVDDSQAVIPVYPNNVLRISQKDMGHVKMLFLIVVAASFEKETFIGCRRLYYKDGEEWMIEDGVHDIVLMSSLRDDGEFARIFECRNTNGKFCVLGKKIPKMLLLDSATVSVENEEDRSTLTLEKTLCRRRFRGGVRKTAKKPTMKPELALENDLFSIIPNREYFSTKSVNPYKTFFLRKKSSVTEKRQQDNETELKEKLINILTGNGKKSIQEVIDDILDKNREMPKEMAISQNARRQHGDDQPSTSGSKRMPIEEEPDQTAEQPVSSATSDNLTDHHLPAPAASAPTRFRHRNAKGHFVRRDRPDQKTTIARVKNSIPIRNSTNGSSVQQVPVRSIVAPTVPVHTQTSRLLRSKNERLARHVSTNQNAIQVVSGVTPTNQTSAQNGRRHSIRHPSQTTLWPRDAMGRFLSRGGKTTKEKSMASRRK